jgi:hypothetical protein
MNSAEAQKHTLVLPDKDAVYFNSNLDIYLETNASRTASLLAASFITHSPLSASLRL